jgi:hypothetical protein
VKLVEDSIKSRLIRYNKNLTLDIICFSPDLFPVKLTFKAIYQNSKIKILNRTTCTLNKPSILHFTYQHEDIIIIIHMRQVETETICRSFIEHYIAYVHARLEIFLQR